MTASPSVNPLAANAPFRRALIFFLFVAVFLLSFFQVTDLDLGGHITVGREIVKTHRIPNADFFTHTVKGAPYPVHQWLGEVILYVADAAGGTTGLILLRIAVVLTGIALLFRLMRREGAPIVVVCAILLLLVCAMRTRFFVRPFLVTLVFLPLLLTFLADVRDGQTRRLWPILPVTALWGHIHSGVIFAVLLLLGTLAGEGVKLFLARGGRKHGRERTVRKPSWDFFARPLDGWNYRRLVIFSVIAIALPFATVALVNPSGVKPLLLPFLFISNDQFTSMIQEYRRVDILVDWPWDFVAGATLLGCLIRPRRVDFTDLVLALGFGFIAFTAVREILCFGIAAAPLLAKTWGSFAEDVFERVGKGRAFATGLSGGENEGAVSRANVAGERAASRGQVARDGGRAASRANAGEAVALATVALACLVAGSAAVRGWLFPFGLGKNPEHYPERALDFLFSQDVAGPMFNTDLFASSFLWRDHGKKYPVFVDARLEAYPQDFWKDTYYRVLQSAPGWQEVLDRHKVQFAFIRRTPGQADDRIGEALWKSEDWGVAYWDDYALVYLRRASDATRNREALQSWEFDAFNPRHPDEIETLRGTELDRALEQVQRLLEWNPESFLLRWTRASGWARSGKAAEAGVEFEELSKERGARKNRPFHRSWAISHLMNGERDRWAEALRRAGGDPSAPAELFAAASLLSNAGARPIAAGFYREVLAADPGHTDAMNNLALLLAEVETTREEALALLDRALQIAPRDAYYWASRGEVKLRMGRGGEAREDLTRALEILPGDDAAARSHVSALLSQALPDSTR